MILNFGKYKGKDLNYVISQEDGRDHLKWYIKRLNNYIENENFYNYRDINIGYKQEIESILNKNSNTLDEKIEIVVQPTIINKEVDATITYENIYNTNDFEKLVNILEQLLLSKLDIKFRKHYNISKQYRDYVCLRITLKTYNEIIKEKKIEDIKRICFSLL